MYFHFLPWPSRSLFPGPSSSFWLTKWSGELPPQGRWCVGCLGGAWRRQVAFQEGDQGPCLLAILSPRPHNTNTHAGCGTWFSLLASAKAKIRIPEASWLHVFFLINISFKSRIACWFSLDLKFQVWKQNTKSFHQTFFLTPWRLSFYICVVLYHLYLWIQFSQ